MEKKRENKGKIEKKNLGSSSNKKDIKSFISVFERYLILIVLGIFLFIFYKIFSPLTIWPSYFLLKFFYNASLSGNFILLDGARIEIIDACVAGSAYYLLLILNLTTKMTLTKRFYSIVFSFSSFLVLNILRIFFLSILFIENFAFFDITHKLFWYALSIVFVIGIWFLTTWIFKIREIPVYSEIRELFKKT